MKLLLIDGYSLLYRAYFSSPPLTTRDGQPTGALYGFLRMVLNLLDEAKPEYALVAMDAHSPTFRHDSDETYKANRAETPDDLSLQTARVRSMLDGMSIPQYEHHGFEADDILGTLSVIGAEKGIDVTIVTGDGDALQLADERVSIMLTKRGVSDLQCYTPDAVRERFGFDPKLVPDYKGLRGDTSDNIPGVPGIGEKTGMKLVTQFGSLEDIYERIEEVTPPRIRDLLKTHREAAFNSRRLARIITDLPVEIDFEACRYELDAPRLAQALETVRTYEFKSLIRRYSDEASASAVAESEANAPTAELACDIKKTADAAETLTWLKEQGAKNKPIGFALDDAAGATFGSEGEALHFEGDVKELSTWLLDEKATKVVHDAKFIKQELYRRDLKIEGIVADTLLMSYLLEPNRQQHSLSVLVGKFLVSVLPEMPVSAEASGAAKGKKGKEAATSLFETEEAEPAPLDEAALAAAAKFQEERIRALGTAACAVYVLEPMLRDELKKVEEEEVFAIELPVIDVLIEMERNGMLIDPVQLQTLGVKLDSDASRLQKEIWELAGEEFNIGSPKQLGVVLFEKLGLAKGRATKSGYSTDVHTLEKLAEDHEIVQKILDYRSVTKLKSTYVDTLLKVRDPATNRIHTTLNQTGAVSGRLSSTDPNLQNIPIRTEQGRLIRKAFVAPPGHVILKVDYSQIELRILAHITQDEPLVEAFRTGQDVHSRTAADLFDVKVEDVDSEMRRKAKMTNYAIAYGVSGFGLAKQLGTGTAGEASAFIKRYFEALPGVRKYMDDTLEAARVDGYVESLLGRRRPLPELQSPRAPERAGAERVAVNHPIQGSAADIMKIAMLAVYEEMQKMGVKSRMMMQVHDELVFDVPEDEIDVLAPILHRLMCDVPSEKLKLTVPLEIDIGTGKNWNDTTPWESKD